MLISEDAAALELATNNNRYVKTKMCLTLKAVYGQPKSEFFGKTFVIHVPPHTGKTTAAAALLRLAAQKNPRGKLIPANNVDQPLKQIVAKQFGVRDADVHDPTKLWEERMFLALNGKESSPVLKATIPIRAKEAANYVFDGISTIFAPCYGYTSDTKPRDVENTQGQYPPVLVLDNVVKTRDGDISFLEAFARKALYQRVLMIITTSDEGLALELISKPEFHALPGFYDETTGKWVEYEWNRAELTKMLELSPFGDYLEMNGETLYDELGYLRFVQDGMLPNEALDQAQKEAASVVPTGVSGASDMGYSVE